jgi:colanic acid biosynthesis glycosyl transferase WcaI
VAILSKYFGSSILHVHIQDLQIEAAREMKLLPGPILSLLEYIEKACFYFADFVTSISDNMVEQTRKKNKGSSTQTEVIENWADTESIHPIEEKNWLKKEYGFSEDTFLIVYSGNIGEKQGLGQILSVAKALEEYEVIKLLILGDGAYKEELLKKSKSMDLSNLRFGKLVPKEYLNVMLNGSDIQLVLQSKHATDSFLPSKYINILSAGVPSIVTAKGKTELHKIVNENNTSLLVEPEDDAQLTDAILKLFRNRELRETLSQNSRKFALEKFGRDFILNRLMNYYREIV